MMVELIGNRVIHCGWCVRCKHAHTHGFNSIGELRHFDLEKKHFGFEIAFMCHPQFLDANSLEIL